MYRFLDIGDDKDESDDDNEGAADDEDDRITLELVDESGHFNVFMNFGVGGGSWVVEGDGGRGLLFFGSGRVSGGWVGSGREIGGWSGSSERRSFCGGSRGGGFATEII